MDVRLVHQQTGYIFQISKFSLISFIYEVASKVFKIQINSIELYYQEKLVPNSDTNALQYFKNFPILIQVKDLTKAGSTIKTEKKRSRKKHYVKCQICRQKKSIFYCRQCNQFICFECNVRFPEHYEHQKINLESGDLLLCFEEYRSIIIKQLDILCNSYKMSKENIIDILERRDIFEKLIQTLKELDKKTDLETSFKCTDQLFKMYSNNLREIEPPKFIEDTEGSFSIINEREHEMRDFIPFINLQIIKSKFNEKMFAFIKTTQKLFNDIMNEINFRLNESTKLHDMTYDDIVQYNTQRMNEDKDSDSDSDISKQLKESISKNNNNKNDENNSNSNSNSNNSNKNPNVNDDKKNSNNINEANSKNSTDSKISSKSKTSVNDNVGDSKKNIPSIFTSEKKRKEKEEISLNKKLFPFILGDINKKSINKKNLLNKIKENALNFDKSLNESKHNRLLLKSLLDKKLKKNKSIESFPLINKFKKNENNSDFNIKLLDDNKNEKNNELFLSHGNLNNLSKSKSQLKIKIFDTINTNKINNIKNSTKIKTDNFKNSSKIKQIRIKDNKNSFSN